MGLMQAGRVGAGGGCPCGATGCWRHLAAAQHGRHELGRLPPCPRSRLVQGLGSRGCSRRRRAPAAGAACVPNMSCGGGGKEGRRGQQTGCPLCCLSPLSLPSSPLDLFASKRQAIPTEAGTAAALAWWGDAGRASAVAARAASPEVESPPTSRCCGGTCPLSGTPLGGEPQGRSWVGCRPGADGGCCPGTGCSGQVGSGRGSGAWRCQRSLCHTHKPPSPHLSSHFLSLAVSLLTTALGSTVESAAPTRSSCVPPPKHCE